MPTLTRFVPAGAGMLLSLTSALLDLRVDAAWPTRKGTLLISLVNGQVVYGAARRFGPEWVQFVHAGRPLLHLMSSARRVTSSPLVLQAQR